MAAKVHCPYCGTAFLYTESNANSEVKCVSCGEVFVPVGAARAESDPEAEPEPEPGERRPARRSPERTSDHNRGYGERSRDWEPRPRRRRPYYDDPIANKCQAPAIFLLVIGILQGCIHLFVGGMMILMALSDDGRREESVEVACVVGVLCLMGFCKDFFVIRGAILMKNGSSRGAALAGAIAGCIPDAGWVFALIPSIWCLVVLNDEHVKRAFERRQYSAYEDDDEDDF